MNPPANTLSSHLLEDALAVAGLGCWAWTPGTAATDAGEGIYSARFHELLGCAPEELPRNPADWITLAHPADQSVVDALFRPLRGDPASGPGEATFRLRHQRGAWAWFQVRLQAQNDLLTDRWLVTFTDVTQQKQTEAALRDSQLRYRALYSTTPLAFILWDRRGHISEWNRRAEAMFGWTAEEVIGKRVHHLLLPEVEHAAFRTTIQQLTQGSGTTEYTGPTQQQSGSLLTCVWYNVALRSPQGGLVGILSLLRDVTEEQQAIQGLQKSEKIYRTLVETSPDAILMLSLDGQLSTVNQQAHRLFGLDEMEDLTAYNIRQFLEPSALGNEEADFLAHPENFSGLIVSRDLPMQRINGHPFIASSSYTTVLDSHGQPAGIVFFARDITDKIQADRELEAHRQNLEQIVQERTQELELARESLAKIIEGSPVPTFVLDAEHTITHWNKACESVIGVTASAMVGTKNQWRAFYDSARPVMADLVMTGEIEQVERFYQSRYRRSKLVPDGFEAEDYFPAFKRWLFFTAAPLRDPQGKIVGAIETLQDVSERKQAELALMDAKGIAERAANAKAEFLANMSHEIRTPMNAVIGLAHLLQRTELSRKQADYIARILGAGEMLMRLINDVLDFSKIEAGRMQLENTRFSLDGMLANVTTVVVNRAQEKGLELQYVVAPDMPSHFIGDPLRLSQILVNLLGNAIKFTAKGFVTAFLRQSMASDGKRWLEIDVQDTGIGMNLEQQKSLFQAFSQADTSITRNFGGTGLGLAICKRLTELMGGRIWVTSEPGIGSTFSLQLLLESAAPDSNAEAMAAKTERRALVVDDNPLARMVLSRLLEKFGCQTQAAESGQQALDILTQEGLDRFDYVTIDLNMPDMNGLALARKIRRLSNKGPKLVLVTAADTHSMEEAGEMFDFDTVLHKPITAAQINDWLEDRQADASAIGTPTTSALRGLHILLAEDIPTNQLIATAMLQSLGITVDTVDNGRAAVEAIDQHRQRYDMVLMDMQMPELDGVKATEEIRRRFPDLSLPIIAMTAHALDEERQRCLAAGMNDFITKPVDPTLLEKALLRWKPTAKPAFSTTTAPAPVATVAVSEPAHHNSDTIPALPGIDTADGLRRMMNKPALYQRVLKDFLTRFANESEVIRAALAANDPVTAERRAHSTKGLSGSIGALTLQAAAKNLEEAIRQQPTRYPTEALEGYESALREVIDGLAAAFPPA